MILWFDALRLPYRILSTSEGGTVNSRAERTLNADQLDLFGELSAYYVQSRYPEEMGQFIPNTTNDTASEVLVKTEESVRWLISLIAL